MVNRTLVHNVIGIIGNIISFGLFLSPVPTFYNMIKKKSVEEYQAYPYLCTVLNCLFWVLYGLPIVKKDNLLVLTTNTIGLAIELIYLTIYCTYTPNNTTRTRILLILVGEAILFGITVVIGILVFDFRKRPIFVGVICVVFNIMMYASPLTIWKKVMKTKSVEFMPFWLSAASFGNGLIWTCYAVVKFDAFILVCNGLGVIFGLIQLIIYAFYYPTTPKHNNKQQAPAAPAQPQPQLQLELTPHN